MMERLLGVSEEKFGLGFDAAIHLGTLLAVLAYYRSLLLSLAAAAFLSVGARKWDHSNESRLAWLVLLGTIPAGAAGYFLEDYAEDSFRSLALVGITLIVFTVPLAYAEMASRRTRTMTDLRPLDSLIIGCAQALALLPGVSRSGISISAGMLRGVQRVDAANYAFLLAIPVIAAAGLKQFVDVTTSGQPDLLDQLGLYAAGLATSALVGYAAIAWFIRFLGSNSLLIFIVYRVVLGAIILSLAAFG